MGVRCTDYDSFFAKNKGKSFETYLLAIENDTHGIFHYTFGGVGGKISYAAIKVLTEKYGFTDSNIATLAISAQPYFKKYLALNQTDPVNCTVNPWQEGALGGTANPDPGSNPGPTCDFSDHFYESEESLNTLISSFFTVDNDKNDRVQTRLYILSLEDRAGAMKVIGNMFPYDGDLAGAGGGESERESHAVSDLYDKRVNSSTTTVLNEPHCMLHIVMPYYVAHFDCCSSLTSSTLFTIYYLLLVLTAMDPLFWVAHGAIERMHQKATISGMFSEMKYASHNHCSGHSATGLKTWLTGFYFTDESIAPELLTNAELTNILNPKSTEYRDLLNYVYDTNSYDWCANSATWFK